MSTVFSGPEVSPSRDFTVATFVVDDGRVLLLYHLKLGMWLPPGGHIEPNELPDDAAVREVREETGIESQLVGERALAIDEPRQLIRPEGIQLENIRPGHQHVDLVYFATPAPGAARETIPCPECERAGWYALAELAALGVNDEIREWSFRAVATVATRLGVARPPDVQ